MRLKHFFGLLLIATPIIFSSCSSTKNIVGTQSTQSSPNALKYKVVKNATKAENVTGSASVELRFGDKTFTVGGNLKMRRNDVIQLTLKFLGMEIGRMEFTKDYVLVIDRFNKQYVRAPYRQVDFLTTANLDFYTLQSLFWGELFVPGKQDVSSALELFSQGESGNHTMLYLANQPKLEYNFLINNSSALIDRVTIESKDVQEQTQLVWKYDAFQSLEGGKIPQTMSMSLKGVGKENGISISLSGISTNSSWQTRTEIPSKYKEQTIEGVMQKIMSLAK